MHPSEIYTRLEQELESGELNDLQKKVFTLLKENPAGLSRHDLVSMIYGYWPETLDNTHDRKIRKAIERLRQRLFPIVSTAGKPGYRLDISREAVNQMLSELRSRKAHIDEQINATMKFYEIPIAYLTDPSEVTQLDMGIGA